MKPSSGTAIFARICAFVVVIITAFGYYSHVRAQNGGTKMVIPLRPLAPLSTVPIPPVFGLEGIIADKNAAAQLGKALFWDMQAGSDDIQACASCHFNAGADSRAINNVNPGQAGGDNTFQLGIPINGSFGPNYHYNAGSPGAGFGGYHDGDFPFHKLSNPNDRNSTVISDLNEVSGSQGVFANKMDRIILTGITDRGGNGGAAGPTPTPTPTPTPVGRGRHGDCDDANPGAGPGFIIGRDGGHLVERPGRNDCTQQESGAPENGITHAAKRVAEIRIPDDGDEQHDNGSGGGNNGDGNGSQPAPAGHSGSIEVNVSTPDPVFSYPDPADASKVINVRKVTGRNTPSAVDAVFNYRNFWDGRAQNTCNGSNPFGARDKQSHLLIGDPTDGNLGPAFVSMQNSALCSQALGPILSSVEMSADGRDFRQVGKKLLARKPLAKQFVDPSDSLLGAFSNAPKNGINISYADLIRKARLMLTDFPYATCGSATT